MSRHADPSFAPSASVPEPTYAERARTLLHLGRTGALATLSRKHPGYPYASVMPYAIDADGRPLLLISTMAVHTYNLLADPRASLLVAQADGDDDPLAVGRVTVIGTAVRVPGADLAAARESYLARHANAGYWVDFDDFAFWRLDVVDVYVVGGFAAMDWVTPDEFRAARPDPLSEAARGILDHMNADHADALIDYARAFADAVAESARMVSVDRLGFKLALRNGARQWSVRIGFPREVRSAEEVRTVLIDMLKRARATKSS